MHRTPLLSLTRIFHFDGHSKYDGGPDVQPANRAKQSRADCRSQDTEQLNPIVWVWYVEEVAQREASLRVQSGCCSQTFGFSVRPSAHSVEHRYMPVFGHINLSDSYSAGEAATDRAACNQLPWPLPHILPTFTLTTLTTATVRIWGGSVTQRVHHAVAHTGRSTKHHKTRALTPGERAGMVWYVRSDFIPHRRCQLQTAPSQWPQWAV